MIMFRTGPIKLGCFLFVTGVLTLFSGANVQAQLSPLTRGVPLSPANQLTTQSAKAEIAGNYTDALRLAEEAIKVDPDDPWGYFDRGDALFWLRRTDDAVAAYREAEHHFPNSDIWGTAVAIWGQAHAFREVGRCKDAAPVLERYAAFVERVDKSAAAQALDYVNRCNAQTK